MKTTSSPDVTNEPAASNGGSLNPVVRRLERKTNMKKHKATDRNLLLTNKHGGIIHTLESFEPGMVAKMKCGLVLVQWRDADSTGRKCKRCK